MKIEWRGFRVKEAEQIGQGREGGYFCLDDSKEALAIMTTNVLDEKNQSCLQTRIYRQLLFCGPTDLTLLFFILGQ